MITLKQLHYAVTVKQTLHFKKAAQQCSVSQSALSASILELEAQLGFALFERDNRQVILTQLGEDFLTRAQDVLVSVEDLLGFARAQSSPLSYPVSLGVIPTVGPFLLPKVLPAVRGEFPELALRITEAPSQVLVEKVRSGALDTAILALPYPLPHLHAFEFWTEDFYVVMHKKDVGRRTKGIRASSLDTKDLLLLEEGHCLKDHALAACRLQIKATEDQAFSGTSLYTLVQMVAGRMGMTLVPAMGLEQLLGDSSELHALHLDEPGPHRSLAFITRMNYPGVKSIEALMACCRQALQKAKHN